MENKPEGLGQWQVQPETARKQYPVLASLLKTWGFGTHRGPTSVTLKTAGRTRMTPKVKKPPISNQQSKVTHSQYPRPLRPWLCTATHSNPSIEHSETAQRPPNHSQSQGQMCLSPGLPRPPGFHVWRFDRPPGFKDRSHKLRCFLLASVTWRLPRARERTQPHLCSQPAPRQTLGTAYRIRATDHVVCRAPDRQLSLGQTSLPRPRELAILWLQL